MMRVRGKTQIAIAGTMFMTIVVILYRMTSGENQAIATGLNRDVKYFDKENINEISPMTQSAFHIARQREYEAKIMADTRRTSKEVKQSHRYMHDMVLAKQIRGRALFTGKRIVHIDLKGAPPKVSYFEEFFPLIRELGATGVLLEYEDMFPYKHKDISAHNAYTAEDIHRILQSASANQLEVIPLIPTFGHFEFVLKLIQYKDLREVPKYPQVVCPSLNATLELIKQLIDDVVSMHPSIKYLHIGCDEVYHLGKCTRCLNTMLRQRWTKKQLFLNHVTTIARYVREKFVNVTPLMWDDEFRESSTAELLESGVGRLVEPMVWNYHPDIDMHLSAALWDKYAQVFPTGVWIATAFKGATGPDKYTTDIGYHLENHRSWMRLVALYTNRITFKGMVITGWQRYDHFAVLCELLPAGLPSLAVNLAYVSSDQIDLLTVPEKAVLALKCDNDEMLMGVGGGTCSFPGFHIYQGAQRLSALAREMAKMTEDSVYKGWLTQYNVDLVFSSPAHVETATRDLDRLRLDMTFIERDMQKALGKVYDDNTVREWLATHMRPLQSALLEVEEATSELDRFKMDLGYIERDMRSALRDVFDEYTVNEWIATYIRPLHSSLVEMWNAKERLLERQDWPQRPLQL